MLSRFMYGRRVVGAVLAAGVAVGVVGSGAAGAATLSGVPAIVGTSTPGTVSNISVGAGVNFGWWSTMGWAAPDMAQLSANGVTEVRQDFRWDLTEVVPGRYDWSRLDNIMTAASNSREDVLPILDYTPVWANGGQSPYVAPTDLSKFANFGAAVVARYGSAGTFWTSHPNLTPAPIHAVEIWDEPWCTNTWVAPNAAVYAQMVRLLAGAVGAVDPNVKIAISTDAMNENGQNGKLIAWVDALVAAFPDMSQYVDVASVHLYGLYRLDATPQAVSQLNYIVNSLASDGVHVPIWVTETGANATAISASLFGAPRNTIVPGAWAVQQNDFTTLLDAVNGVAVADNVRRVYAFSFSRSASLSTWNPNDSVDSGWLLEGPGGVVRGGGLGTFAWIAAHQAPASS